MLNQAVLKGLNEQIKHELDSAYIYLAVSAYCDRKGLVGFARWMRAQSHEELEHALKIYDFILDRDGVVELQAVDKPGTDFGTPLQIAEKTLEHEQRVTGLIHELYALAVKENDYPAQTMLQWFIAEQVEEEKNATLLVDRFRLAGDNPAAVLMLDMELAKRGLDAGEAEGEAGEG